MSQAGGYREELESEMSKTDPNSHANRLLAQEIERLTGGDDDSAPTPKKEKPIGPLMEIHTDRPQKVSIRVRVPVREHPRYNFVGKLLGPKGSTLKSLQDQTACKMAIMGKGSMREKDKEEELRKEGGKYAHLNEDLHVLVECFSEVTDGYHRLAGALGELRKFLIPEIADDMYGGGDMGMNGAPPTRGRGFGRGGPAGAERGGRGGYRGRGGAPGSAPTTPRGAPAVRGAGPPPRGAPRGAPSGRGGAPRGRAPPPAAPPSAYDGYGQQSYGAQGYGAADYAGYEDYSGRDASYDYYGGQTAASGYDSYSAGAYDYGEAYTPKAAPPSRGGAARPAARAHPYPRPAQSGY